MADCTEAEVKVMLYLLRRTRGFQKVSDQVSVRQICHGLRRKQAGAALELGTGLTMGAVSGALTRLVEKGLITRERGSGTQADRYTPTITQRSENRNHTAAVAKSSIRKSGTLSVPESRTLSVRKTRTTKERGNTEETKRPRQAPTNQSESPNPRAAAEPSQSSSAKPEPSEELITELQQFLDLKKTLGYSPDRSILIRIATELGDTPLDQFKTRASMRIRTLRPESYGIFVELAKDAREAYTSAR